jgi:hypothetical protein
MNHPVVADRIDTNELKHQLKDVKICRISTVPFFIVSQLKGQVEYLRDIGMNVLLVSSEGPEWSMVNIGHGLGVKIINITRSLKPWRDFISLIKLIQLFFIHRFDIVHSTTPKAGLLTAIAAFISRTPVRLHTFTGQPWVTLQGLMRWSSRSADKLIGILNTKCYADRAVRHNLWSGRVFYPLGRLRLLGRGHWLALIRLVLTLIIGHC